MRKYLIYFMYLLNHKKDMFIQCMKDGLFIHAFTHDLSSFLPSEFIAYANWLFDDYGIKFEKSQNDKLIDIRHYNIKKAYEKAYLLHCKRNKHHLSHWAKSTIPDKYLYQFASEVKVHCKSNSISLEDYYSYSDEISSMASRSKLLLREHLGLTVKNVVDC